MSRAKRRVYAAAITSIDADDNSDQAGLVGYCPHLFANGCHGEAPLRNPSAE